MNCPKCNYPNDSRNKFCQNCGTPLPQNINTQKSGGSGLAKASLILGIVGLVFTFVVIGIAPAIVGLILGIVAISMNKIKQAYIDHLTLLASMKSQTIQKNGEDYKFNEAGDQVRYFYPMEEIVSINYDRNVVKGIIKKLKKETDEVSLKLDQIQLNTKVDFEPKYSLDDSLEDVVSQ